MTKSNPKNGSLKGSPKPSEEEIMRQKAVALMQQRNAMAQAFATTICQSTTLDQLKKEGAASVATFAGDLADAMMEIFYPNMKED